MGGKHSKPKNPFVSAYNATKKAAEDAAKRAKKEAEDAAKRAKKAAEDAANEAKKVAEEAEAAAQKLIQDTLNAEAEIKNIINSERSSRTVCTNYPIVISSSSTTNFVSDSPISWNRKIICPYYLTVRRTRSLYRSTLCKLSIVFHCRKCSSFCFLSRQCYCTAQK
jgi:hypothetical protein